MRLQNKLRSWLSTKKKLEIYPTKESHEEVYAFFERLEPIRKDFQKRIGIVQRYRR